MTDITEFPIATALLDPAFRATATHIQWRLTPADAWADLTALSALEGADGVDGTNGADGREAEFRQSATHIQWRLVGDVAWIDLVPLADLIPQDAVTSTDVTSIAVVTEYPATEDPDVLYIKVPV